MNKSKLICLAHAGGSAQIFKEWGRVCNSIEFIPIEYSGRGSRIGETLFANLNEMVDDVYKQILIHINECEKYSIFGHSFGGLVAFELIRNFDFFTPEHVFISGMGAPHKRKSHSFFHLLPDDQFIEKIKHMNGTPSAVLENKELMDLFLPILRADFKMNNEYQYNTESSRIKEDLSIIFGNKDHIIDRNNILSWRDLTDGDCDFFEIDGDHFYVNRNYSDVLNIISKKCLHQ
ncbi:thioesterase [Bacillus toyonensis]|uniref:thioesterase II family protein n=1 Tax=Bacillus TaxID=1386 RepID=UPI0001A076F0|nr:MULTISPECIES: thioesterase domain-containing protein [Bacillus]EEL19433.1 Thioesterase [Bacillus cereus Rock1-3]KXY16728.1 oleoyl-ACP hydrolase [Bacillus cereus]MDH8708536.1 medium-chain acyl-[acyl-carrier-protein] hydrolase [Stenotrophomonas sp. 1198]MDP9749087.1 medium-chain acyl-[acyl-carrier-protein] hydrolase [Bacillus thuringiensis]MDF9890777.1 medium-chain acyl-[acyl-carrier-protein] hydrolase [Bacillus sp. LEw-kw-24]